jgi:hypothetical protein
MKVFVFDLLAYGEQLEHLKIGTELPYPLQKKGSSLNHVGNASSSLPAIR